MRSFYLSCSSALKMEAIRFSETSVNFTELHGVTTRKPGRPHSRSGHGGVEIMCMLPLRELNLDPLVAQPAAYSLYRLSYPGPIPICKSRSGHDVRPSGESNLERPVTDAGRTSPSAGRSLEAVSIVRAS